MAERGRELSSSKIKSPAKAGPFVYHLWLPYQASISFLAWSLA